MHNAADSRHAAIQRLKAGLPPGDAATARSVSAGIGFVSDFLRDMYLPYIANGGSKIKFVTGREGSGKTHLLELMLADAADAGFKAASFSAKNIWLNDFKEIYFEVLRTVDLMDCLAGCRDSIIRQMGFRPEDVPSHSTFADYLSAENQLDAITKREIRQTLSGMFLKNPHNFAFTCSLLTGYLLGYPTLEEPNRDMLLSWLSGSKDVRLPALRKLGLSPTRITKFNARHMLRSLAQAVRAAGYKGLFIAVDDLDILISDDSLEELHYTKIRREDTYESLRQLIDEIDTLSGVFITFAFRRELIDDDKKGLKSYQALWMRIQNEVSSKRFNRFADIIDLDALARQEYGSDVIIDMSRKLAETLSGEGGLQPIGESGAKELLERLPFARTALPKQVNAVTVGRWEESK